MPTMNYLDLIDSFAAAAAAVAATPSSENFEERADSNHVDVAAVVDVAAAVVLGDVVHVAAVHVDVVSWTCTPIRKEIDSAALP
jgi:threonine/homoserine/homoserine lactone efflux protein